MFRKSREDGSARGVEIAFWFGGLLLEALQRKTTISVLLFIYLFRHN